MVNLERHLRLCHKWTPGCVKGVRNRLGLRREREIKAGNKKKQFTAKVCPIPSCNRLVKRLNNHLRQVHKITEKKKIVPLLSQAQKSTHCMEAKKLEAVVPNILKSSLGDAANNERTTDAVNNEREIRENEDSKECLIASVEPCQANVFYDVENLIEDEESSEDEEDTDEEETEFFVSDADVLNNIPESNLKTSEQADHVFSDICKFKIWLKSVDGGRKTDRLANAHASQILVVHKAVNGDSSLEGLNDMKAVRDKWLMPFITQRQPGTTMTYLHSLIHWYNFVINENSCSFQFDAEMGRTCIGKVKHWTKSMRKQLTRRKWEKRAEDAEKLATPEDFATFDNSEIVRSAIKIVGNFMSSSGMHLRKREYTTVRDYLISILCTDNGSRTGAIANMTIEEVRRAEKDGDAMLITVLDHKTLQSTGPAILVLSLATFSYLDVFIQKIRGQVPIAHPKYGDNVFLRWNGKAMNTSRVSEQFRAFWYKAVGKHMNASIMRKSCVSQVHFNRPDMKVELAAHMCHSVKTAENVYCLKEKKANSAKTSLFLRNIMRQDGGHEDRVKQPEKRSSSPDLFQSLAQSDRSESAAGSKSEDSQLRSIFKDIIESENPPSMSTVKGRLNQNAAFIGRSRAIYGKIQYWIRQKKSESASLPNEIETNDERLERYGLIQNKRKEKNHYQSSVSDMESSVQEKSDSEGRLKFSKADGHIIANIFKDYVTCQRVAKADEVIKISKESHRMRHLNSFLDEMQIVDKVRNMAKKYKKEHK